LHSPSRKKSSRTRADLIKYLDRVLPRTGWDPAAAAALLKDLAVRALRSQFDRPIEHRHSEVGQRPGATTYAAIRDGLAFA
jgi:hypothetical protein